MVVGQGVEPQQTQANRAQTAAQLGKGLCVIFRVEHGVAAEWRLEAVAANVADPISAAPLVESQLPFDRHHVTDLEPRIDLEPRARIYTCRLGGRRCS